MKKLFTFITALTLSVFAFSTTPHRAMTNSTSASAVEVVYHEVSEGDIYFVWTGSNDSTEYYDIQVGVLNDTRSDYTLIAEGAWKKEAFAVSGYNNYYQMYSSLVLEYGENYTSYPKYFSQDLWESSVKSDFTLNPGVYVIFIEGINSDWKTTESYAYVVEQVFDTTTDWLPSTSSKLIQKKFIVNGQLYIRNGNKIFDACGRQVNITIQ